MWIAALLFCLEANAQIAVEGAPEEKPKAKKEETIKSGDRIRIKIYPEDEYIRGGEMVVSTEGTIGLPLIGKVQVDGMGAADAERKIVDLLVKDYLVDPIVVIEPLGKEPAVASKISVSVLGQVKQPGNINFPPEGEMSLLKAISMAGGFTDIANPHNVKVVRKSGKEARVIEADAEDIISGKDEDIELEPNDVINVGEAFF
jgi:polysaccharide export outer membrane protein